MAWQGKHKDAFMEVAKINFQGMKLEYELEIAIARRQFILAAREGMDSMLRSLKMMETLLVRYYRDNEYIERIRDIDGRFELESKRCINQHGKDSDKMNMLIENHAYERWEAANELLFRRHLAPQIAEHGVLD